MVKKFCYKNDLLLATVQGTLDTKTSKNFLVEVAIFCPWLTLTYDVTPRMRTT